VSDIPEGKPMLAGTIQLALRIAIVWAADMVLAVAIEAVLPDKAGFNIAGKQGTLFIPFSRVGFWTCIIAAVIVTGLVVYRAILADIGWSSVQ
jgi:cytochrome b subunit of formate dehydrogenase